MLGRSDTFRAAAIIALIAVVVVSLVAINRRLPPVVDSPSTVLSPASDDLSAELRRCSALGPQDTEDARCVAVWEENRRRFFGRPARSLPPQTPPEAVAPATHAAGGAR